MNAITKKLENELQLSIKRGFIPMFEIEVVDRSGQSEWILCDIYFECDSIVARIGAVSSKEQNSQVIATSTVVCDDCFTLDEHLQALHEEVINAIIAGDLYDIA